jgi:hypothetical protein
VSLAREALIARWTAASHHSARLLEPTAPVTSPPANLRALAAAELTAPGRYHLTAAVAPASGIPFWTRVWTWLYDRWMDLWKAAFGSAHLGRAGAVAIGDVLIAIVALAIVVVAIRLLASLSLEGRRLSAAEPLESAADSRALYAAACDRARRGEYARASQLLFAATIAALALRGLVRDDRSATVGDFRRDLRRDDASLIAPFDSVSNAFVTGAYAEQPVDADQWERARAAYLSLAGRAEA